MLSKHYLFKNFIKLIFKIKIMDYSKLNTLKLETYQKISKVLSEKREIGNKISRFGAALEQLDLNRKKLEELHSLLSNESGPMETIKDVQRNDLVEKTLFVITIMQIFAYDKKKKNLEQRLDCLTPEYLQTCTDAQLINASKKVWVIANKYGVYSLAYVNKIKAKLNPDKSKAIIKLEKEYGLIPDMIKNIEEANIKFIETLVAYQVEMKENEKIIKKIKKTYKQTESLLQNKIDRFVLLFAKDHPDFYKEYQDARKIAMLKEIKTEGLSNEENQVEGSQDNEEAKAQPEKKQRSQSVKKAEV